MTSQSQENETHTLISNFLETKQSRETVRAYKREINGFIAHLKANGHPPDTFLTIPFPTMCDQITVYLASQRTVNLHTGRIKNPRSINRKLYALSSFFLYLQKKHDYPGNPTKILESIPVPRKSSTPSPTSIEIQSLLDFLKAYRLDSTQALRNTVLILMLFLMALRRSEAVACEWSNINLTEGTLTLIQKGGTEKRLPIPKILITLLTQYKKAAKTSTCPYVFHDLRKANAQPITGSTAYNIVRGIITSVFPGSKLSPHSFRKAFIEQAPMPLS